MGAQGGRVYAVISTGCHLRCCWQLALILKPSFAHTHTHTPPAGCLSLSHSGHLGLEPSSTQLAHLIKEARAAGEFVQHPQLALRYTQLAAERGVKGAASALSHAYATGRLVGCAVIKGQGQSCLHMTMPAGGC